MRAGSAGTAAGKCFESQQQIAGQPGCRSEAAFNRNVNAALQQLPADGRRTRPEAAGAPPMTGAAVGDLWRQPQRSATYLDMSQAQRSEAETAC